MRLFGAGGRHAVSTRRPSGRAGSCRARRDRRCECRRRRRSGLVQCPSVPNELRERDRSEPHRRRLRSWRERLAPTGPRLRGLPTGSCRAWVWTINPSLNVVTHACFPTATSMPVERPRIRKSSNATTRSPASTSVVLELEGLPRRQTTHAATAARPLSVVDPAEVQTEPRKYPFRFPGHKTSTIFEIVASVEAVPAGASDFVEVGPARSQRSPATSPTPARPGGFEGFFSRSEPDLARTTRVDFARSRRRIFRWLEPLPRCPPSYQCFARYYDVSARRDSYDLIDVDAVVLTSSPK